MSSARTPGSADRAGTYLVRYTASIDIAVTVEAEDENHATEASWALAQQYTETIYGDDRDVRAAVSLDGVGAYEIEALE